MTTARRTQVRDRMGFYTVEKLGKTREVTPDGFLVCRDVPIARTGVQLYQADEVPIDATASGEIRVERLPDEVFRDETIASFEGKPVTVGHPDEEVTPENWSKYAVGTVQNVRRGEGIEDDLLIADLLITAADAIAYVNKELPEVSCGYSADYEQTEPGRAMQRNIVGNHLALVERGRAGPRCSIQDHQPQEETTVKKAKAKDASSLLARLLKAIRVADAEEIKKTMEDAETEEKGEGDPEVKTEEGRDENPNAELSARLDKIEAILAKLIPTEEAEHGENFDENPGEEEMTGDDVLNVEKAETNTEAKGEVLTGDSLKQVIARAEILAPGIAIPTGDAIKAKDAAGKLMRKALDTAMGTEQGRACVDTFLMGREVKKLTGDALTGVFAGAAELMRVRNNDKGLRSGVTSKDFGKAVTVADLNARNREFWANRNAR